MDLDFLDEIIPSSPTPAKSVRFHHHDHDRHTHNRRDDKWPPPQKGLGSSNSLNVLIPQVDVGSPVSPIIGQRSPRVHQFLHSKNVAGYGSENDVHTASINDANEDWNFHSYHLDYKHTPPLVKGPCCVCGDGIIGAMVTALDKMWHPEHFRCVNCNLELIGPNYLEHDGKPYCKSCHNILFLPPCFACKRDIQGQYVNALDHIFHTDCFRCTACEKVLTPPNFMTKDFKPYCEEDYHKLFSPKCQLCRKPIKPNVDYKVEVGSRQWHKSCFKCCVCRKNLDPNTFKEKNGKLYCEHDYNDLFKPKCAECNRPILQTPLSAMNKEFHPECFRCTECKKGLTPTNFLEKDGKPYCEHDYHKLFSPKCAGCNGPIKNKNQMIQAQGKNWHPEHFKCTECHKILDPKKFFEKNGLPYCEDDYHRLFSPKCAGTGCGQPIKNPSDGIKAQGKTWHKNHFTCTVPECRKILDPNRFFEKNGLPYCEDDYHRLFSSKCAGCMEPIKDPSKLLHAHSKTWHPSCFTCSHCTKVLDPTNFYEMEGRVYCEKDFYNLFGKKCAQCSQPIREQKYVHAMEKQYHPNCFRCAECGKVLQENNFYEKDGLAYCVDDFMRLFAPKCQGCTRAIVTEYCLAALGSDWHPECFRCSDCGTLLENRDFYEYEGRPYCEPHYHARMCPDCMKLRRAENHFLGIKDERAPRPNSALFTMATDSAIELSSSADSRPSSQMSQIYDVRQQQSDNYGWKDTMRSIPITNSTSSSNSYNICNEDIHHHYHDHHLDAGCTGNHYEKKILADANANLAVSRQRERNVSGETIRSSGTSTPVPFVTHTLHPMKSNHQHKHEKYFETGVVPPGKFPIEGMDGDNMRFQTFVTKDESMTVSRNY